MALKLLEVPRPEEQITDEALKQAISIRATECYGAMRMCNMLGGTQDLTWRLIYANSFPELLAEADARGIDCTQLKCAVSGTPVAWSGTYLLARDVITLQDMQSRFQIEVKRGDGEWKNPNG